jgi:hypothetical protein
VVHRPRTAESLAGLYRESCAIVLRHYRRPLTVAVVARALAGSPDASAAPCPIWALASE